MYVNAAAVLRLLTDIKAQWDIAGLGDDPQISDPLYARLEKAIEELTPEDE